MANLNIAGKNIEDLTGIENFTALTQLFCNLNNLSNLDLSKNTALTLLDCSINNLQFLNIKNGNNSNMTFFNALNNSNSLCINVDNIGNSEAKCSNFKDETATYKLYCDYETLTYVPDDNFEQDLINKGIDPSPYLDDYVPTDLIHTITELDVNEKDIADLTGIEDFEMLEVLNCSNNILTGLDLSNNTMLTTLSCQGNMLIDLDVSANMNLDELYCQNQSAGSLTGLNIKNGRNSVIENSEFDARGNPNLSCIQVDDPVYSNREWANRKPESAIFRTECDLSLFTRIPDNNFEFALRAYTNDSGPLDGLVLTEELISIELLSIEGKNIEDLSGIEAFTNLVNLFCQNNRIKDLDLSANVNLTILNCSNNQLTNLNVSQNTALTNLYCSFNSLGGVLDLSLMSGLRDLVCTDNGFSGLNLKNGNNRNMTGFDAKSNPNLECIQVDGPVRILRLLNPYSRAPWADGKTRRMNYRADCSNATGYVDSDDDDIDSVFVEEATANFSEDNSVSEAYELFPNPVTNILNISSEKTIDAIYVVNAQGFTVITTTETQIDFSYLAPGVYIVNIISGEDSIFKRVIKN